MADSADSVVSAVVGVDDTRRKKPRRGQALPGLVPTLGFTWLYLTVLVLLPLSWLLFRASMTPWSHVVEILSSPRTRSALRLSFGCAIAAAFLNVGFGLVTAWVLARYKFPGRGLLDAIVELPFAVPTSVAGITLTFLYSEHGWFGRWLTAAGVNVAFTPLGIIIAVTFVGLPFVVRTVQPVLQEMDRQAEEAAGSLGASPWQTFWRVQFPLILPALITGFALALARGIGEYGSVLFISGNLPMRTEIMPLLIVSKLEQYDYDGAAVLAATMLAASLALLVFVHVFERWVSRRFSGVQVGR
jgi:sulfate transport system permease protein